MQKSNNRIWRTISGKVDIPLSLLKICKKGRSASDADRPIKLFALLFLFLLPLPFPLAALPIVRPELPLLLHLRQFLRCRFWHRYIKFADEFQIDVHFLSAAPGGFVRRMDEDFVCKLIGVVFLYPFCGAKNSGSLQFSS